MKIAIFVAALIGLFGNIARGEDAPEKMSIPELHVKKAELAKKAYAVTLVSFKNGLVPQDSVIAASKRWMISARESAANKEAELAIIKEYRERAKQSHALIKAMHEAGRSGPADLMLAEYDLVDAELILKTFEQPAAQTTK